MQIVKQDAKTIEEGFELLKEAAILDYNSFMKDNASMQSEFRDSFRLENGQKYAKVISKNSVFAFIVKEDMKTKYGQPMFKKGDILKAASWSAPAKNRARGNILEGNYPIQWTGPLYLN